MTEKTKPKYKAIVFDYGGVIEFFSKINPIQIAADMLGVSFDTFRSEYFKHNHLSNIENIPWDEMFAKVVSVFSDSLETTKRVMDKVNESRSQSTLNQELINTLPDLKAKGFRVGLFSNYAIELRNRLKDKGLLSYFDEIVISGEIGVQKPSKEAFEILFEKINLKPEEVIFIDDAQKSLELAEEIGYFPIRFKDNEQLMEELRNLGINIQIP